MADPQRAATELKRLYPLLDEQIEAERIIYLRDRLMLTDRTRQHGLTYLAPERVAESIRTVQEGFGLASVPTVEQIFDPRFLPSAEERRLRMS
jgi:NitT/TauT family transport system substrate-binding protein